jgi:hypothetical protein
MLERIADLQAPIVARSAPNLVTGAVSHLCMPWIRWGARRDAVTQLGAGQVDGAAAAAKAADRTRAGVT